MAFLKCACGSMLKGIQKSQRVTPIGEYRTVEYRVGAALEHNDWKKIDESMVWLKPLADGVYCERCTCPLDLDLKEAEVLTDKRIPGVSSQDFNSSAITERLKGLSEKERSEIFVHTIPQRSPKYGELNEDLPIELYNSLQRMNIKELYTHQADTYNAVRKKNNVVLVTQTASGKTMSYNLPVLHGLLENPNATALYLFPTKALADDQVEQLFKWTEQIESEDNFEYDEWFERAIKLGATNIHYGRYDGDTQLASRKRLLEDGRILFTNPDMIHHSLLKQFADQGRQYHNIHDFFKNLRFIVIDEMHLYRGAFGTHVSMVLRRLRKVCEELGNDKIQFILCSATIDRPDLVAEDLTGLKGFQVIDNDGSKQNERNIVFWNPGENLGTGSRKAPITDALAITEDVLVQDKRVIRSIVFQGSRLQGKVTAKYMKDILRKVLRLPKERLKGLTLTAFYNGMLSVEERKAVIESIKKSDVHIVLSTNALEVGIDIGELSFALLIGYPGSKAAFSQQIGRVGRSGEGVAVMIFEDEPLQQYYMNNPKLFLEKPPEVVRIDPQNKQLLKLHLAYLQTELSRKLNDEDIEWFIGDKSDADKIVSELDDVDIENRCSLRSVSSVFYTVLSTRNREIVIDGIDEWTAFRDFHNGAIYWTANEKAYKVDSVNRKKHEIIAAPVSGELEYYTQSIYKDTINISDQKQQTTIGDDLFLATGSLDIRRNVFGYNKIYFSSRQQEKENLEIPLTSAFESEGVWITFSEVIIEKLKSKYPDKLEGSIRAAEHVMVSIIPDTIICDGKDIASFSSLSMSGFDYKPVIGFYGNQSGGMGTSLAIADHFNRIIDSALNLLNNCSCNEGCPSCVQYPGKDNDNLFKTGAKELLLSLKTEITQLEEEKLCR
jgi:DEAD/DEAH box helicase domain-containing protein